VAGYSPGGVDGHPPDRQYGQGEEMHISRIAEGRIVERWGQGDNLGMMQQLGVVPPPGQGES
jgi:predicted ester cyclase